MARVADEPQRAPEELTPPVRLFLGGLPENISASDVTSRFVPFGTLESVQVVPDKSAASSAQGGKGPSCRGFAYVDFRPKDDKALSRCFSLYNGCVWKGNKLRVERAKPSYMAKLKDQWAAEEQEAREETEQLPEEADSSQPRSAFDAEDAQSRALHLPGNGGKVVSVPLVPKHSSLTHKKYFPPMKSNLSEATLSWESPEHEYSRHDLLLMEAAVGLPTPAPAGINEAEQTQEPTVADAVPLAGPVARVSPLQTPAKSQMDMEALTPTTSGSGKPTGRSSPLDSKPEATVLSDLPARRQVPQSTSSAGAGPSGRKRSRGVREAVAVSREEESSGSEDYAALKSAVAQRRSANSKRGEDAEFEVVKVGVGSGVMVDGPSDDDDDDDAGTSALFSRGYPFL